MTQEQQQAHLEEIEAVYRCKFDRFLHVATAITDSVELAADCVQEAFARAIRLRGGHRGQEFGIDHRGSLIARGQVNPSPRPFERRKRPDFVRVCRPR